MLACATWQARRERSVRRMVPALLLQVCKTMRGMFGSQAIPICMCTALGADSHDQIEACKQAGSSDVLLKPFERIKVLDMIHKHCGHKVGGAGARAGR